MMGNSAQDTGQKDVIENGGLYAMNELMIHQLHTRTLKHVYYHVWNWLFPFFPLQVYFPIP